MKLIGKNGRAYTLEIDEAELDLINNALNEVCNGIDIPEFKTRLGQSQEVAKDLLQRLNSLLPTR